MAESSPASTISPSRPVQWWRTTAHHWHRRSLFQKNLIVGIVLHALMALTHDSPWRRGIEDGGLDWMMRIVSSAGAAAGRPQDVPVPFAFIDIDERTYQNVWKEPAVTPHDKLAALIRFAAESGARVVVVDVDLNRRDGQIVLAQGNTDPLADLLAAYPPQHPASSGRPWPPVVLVRSFRQAVTPGPPGRCQVERASFLDDRAGADVWWATMQFEAEADGVVRRWRLWETACQDHISETRPSVELLTTALLREQSTGAQRVSCWLAALPRQACPECPRRAPLPSFCQGDNGSGGSFELDGLSISAKASDLSQRILYTIPWNADEEAGRARIGSKGALVLTVLSAGAIAGEEAPAMSAAARAALIADRVVVIGGSYADGRDIHSTPIGRMPGALVLINAINSLHMNGQLRPVPSPLEYGIMIVLLVGQSYLLSRFRRFWGSFLSVMTVVVITVPLSFYFLRIGQWLDFAIPLMGVQLHHTAERLEETLEHESAEPPKTS
jgi:hypothetical protein